MGQRNHEDSERKSAAVKKGMRRRAESGKPNGGPRPYGYRYENGGFVVVDAEAAIVRRIFSEFLAGRSLTAIARDLHSAGLSTVRGGLWRQSTVGGIVRNPEYAGFVRNHEELFEGDHEPLVDRADWEQAQTMLAARDQKGRGRPPKGRHLFRGGMLRCACGEAIVPRTNGGYEMYYCNGRQKFGKDFCSVPHIRRRDIDEPVYRYFERVGLDVEATRAQLAEAHARQVSEIVALREQAQGEAQRAHDRLARVRRDYMDGKLAAGDWTSFRDELAAETEAAEAEAARLQGSEDEVRRRSASFDAEQATLEALSEIRRVIAGEVHDARGSEAVRAALSRLFTNFVLHPRVGARYATGSRAELVDVAESYMIEMEVVPQALIQYGSDEHPLLPVLRRKPLPLADKQHVGLPCR